MMIYDALPINDLFRKVDDNTLVSAMDFRLIRQPFSPSSSFSSCDEIVPGIDSVRISFQTAPPNREASAAIGDWPQLPFHVRCRDHPGSARPG
jgi:hypothetical protein